MVVLRRLDAFAKTRPDLRQKSAVGGIITVLASSTAALLFFGQLYVYIVGDTRHSLRLSRSISFPLIPIPKEGSGGTLAHQLLSVQGKMTLSFHVTFLDLDCSHLDVMQDGASHRGGELSRNTAGTRQFVTLRKPTPVERKKSGMTHQESGCTVEGMLRPPQVAGTFQITVSSQAWSQASALVTMLQSFNPERIPAELKKYNVSHYIHKIEFGKTFAQAVAKPLENRPHIIDNEFGGIAVEQIQVKLVPTISEGMSLCWARSDAQTQPPRPHTHTALRVLKGFLYREQSYQQSVVEHTVQPETLIANGMQYLPGEIYVVEGIGPYCCCAFEFVTLTHFCPVRYSRFGRGV